MNLSNKPNSIYTLLIIFLLTNTLLIELSFVGCSNKPTEKTIIMNNDKIEDSETKPLTVINLSNVTEYGMSRGWIDDSNIVLLTSKFNSDNSDEYLNYGIHKWLEMKKIDINNYKSLNITENRIIRDASISSDKSKIAFIEELDNNLLQIVVKELSTGNEIVVTTIDKRTHFNWSNNNKYLSIVKMDMILVYDSELDSIIEIPLPELDVRYEDTEAEVSNDGNNILIKNKNLYLVDISIQETLLQNQSQINYITLSTDFSSEDFDYWDNSTILYTSSTGLLTGLYSYNLSTNKSTLINDNVAGFSISPNHQYISYYEYVGSSLYVGTFNGTNISDNSIVFNGYIQGDIWWNTMSTRILFYGESNDEWNNYIATFN